MIVILSGVVRFVCWKCVFMVLMLFLVMIV